MFLLTFSKWFFGYNSDLTYPIIMTYTMTISILNIILHLISTATVDYPDIFGYFDITRV